MTTDINTRFPINLNARVSPGARRWRVLSDIAARSPADPYARAVEALRANRASGRPNVGELLAVAHPPNGVLWQSAAAGLAWTQLWLDNDTPSLREWDATAGRWLDLDISTQLLRSDYASAAYLVAWQHRDASPRATVVHAPDWS